MPKLQADMVMLQQQMDKIFATTDPKERQKLLQEHMQTMQENMKAMGRLRRGFAQWATANDWDIKMLMEYVGWKNVQSALRYVEGADPLRGTALSNNA